MKAALRLFLSGLILAAGTLKAQPGNPDSLNASMAEAEAIRKALASPPDTFGIPIALYDRDAKLERYRRSAEQRLESNRSTGKGIIAVGVAGAVLSGLLFAIANENSKQAEELRNSANVVVTSDPSGEQYAYAVVDGIISLACIGYGLNLISRTAPTESMHRYYHEKYDAYLTSRPTPGLHLAWGGMRSAALRYELNW